MPIIARPKEIWKIDLEDAEGHEQYGERPAVILSIHNDANVCMAVPFTSNLDTLRFPFSYRIIPSVNNGLTVVSVALVYQTRCITGTRLLRRMGNIDQADLDVICTLLRTYLNLS